MSEEITRCTKSSSLVKTRLSFVCVLGTYDKFVGGKIDYFFCPEALAFAFAGVLKNFKGHLRVFSELAHSDV